MSTRIFKVQFNFAEYYDGKRNRGYTESRTVTAKDAEDAIKKAKVLNEKPHSYIDEKKKKVMVTRKDFDPINCTLEAESD